MFEIIRGFEADIITSLVMLSRMPGVMAHWREATSEFRGKQEMRRLTSSSRPTNEPVEAPTSIHSPGCIGGPKTPCNLQNPEQKGGLSLDRVLTCSIRGMEAAARTAALATT